MRDSRKKLLQGLLLCSPLVMLSLQAAPVAVNLPELGEPVGQPPLQENLPLPGTPASSKLRPLKERQPSSRMAAGQQMGALTSQWLNQWGQAEILFNDALPESALPTGHLAVLLPLNQQPRQLLLTQWGVLRNRQQTTWHIGLGQRWFNQTQGYWGYNVFYDYRRSGNHGRLGLGLEQRGATRTLALNSYLPLSSWRMAEDRTTQSRPAKGVDLRLQQQLPHCPQLQFNAVAEHYFTQALAAEIAQQAPARPTAFTLGVDYTPMPLLTTSYAYQLASGGRGNHQLQLKLIYRLGVPWAQQLDPTQVAQVQSLAGSRYALIQRHSKMILEQRAYQATKEVPKLETIQITLPSAILSGLPGQSLIVAITLTSKCPIAEWQFTGEGSFVDNGGTYQVDVDKQQLTLQFPHQAGDYSLQIIASKAQGSIARSNTLQVQVRAPAVVPPTLTAADDIDSSPHSSLSDRSDSRLGSSTSNNPFPEDDDDGMVDSFTTEQPVIPGYPEPKNPLFIVHQSPSQASSTKNDAYIPEPPYNLETPRPVNSLVSSSMGDDASEMTQSAPFNLGDSVGTPKDEARDILTVLTTREDSLDTNRMARRDSVDTTVSDNLEHTKIQNAKFDINTESLEALAKFSYFGKKTLERIDVFRKDEGVVKSIEDARKLLGNQYNKINEAHTMSW
jgi:Inverse autotransporter, beta-domain